MKRKTAKPKNLEQIKKRHANKVKKLQKSHSSFWIDDVGQFVDDPEVEVNKDDKLIRLASIRRAIANFVKIGSGTDIPVRFSSGHNSYTDGTTVVIAASDNPTKFDSQVGLALHEASHIKYSAKSLAFIRRDLSWFEDVYKLLGLTAKASRAYNPATGVQPVGSRSIESIVHQDVHFIMNLLEDRRIDTLTYRFAPGYRPYYKSLYSEFFMSRQIKQVAKSVESHIPTARNYFFWIGTMQTELFEINAIPGLRDVVNLMDLKNPLRFGDDDPNWDNVIEPYLQEQAPGLPPKQMWLNRSVDVNTFRLNDMPLLFSTALKVAERIYDLAITPPEWPSSKSKQQKKKSAGQPSDLPNLDGGTGDEGEMTAEEAAELMSKLTNGKIKKEDIEKALREMQDSAAGNIKKKKVTQKDAKRIEDLVEARAELKEAGKDMQPHDVAPGRGTNNSHTRVPVVVYREVNKKNVTKIPFGNSYPNRGSQQALQDGFRMGQRLAHSIRIMNDDKTTKYIRQNEGRIDRRLLSGLGYEQENVFYRIVNESIRPVHVHLSIDASGSMSGTKWQNAMTLAVALAVAADKIRTMRVVIDVRAGLDYNAGLAIIYDSAKDRLRKLTETVPYLATTGSTPEGLCFEAIMDDIISRTGNERKYFINLSDGQPAFSSYARGGFYYSGEPALAHTARQVQLMRDAGVKVLSYFISYAASTYGSYGGGIGYDQSAFKTMYGQDASFIDPKSIPSIAMTLNKLFLE